MIVGETVVSPTLFLFKRIQNMSVTNIAAMVSTMVTRDIATRATGIAPDVAALESISNENVKHRSFISMANGSELSLLYGEIVSRLQGRTPTLDLVESIITDDTLLMDSYQRVMWDEAKKASELRADMRNIEDTSDMLTAALRPIVSVSPEDAELTDVEVLETPELAPGGMLDEINAATQGTSDGSLLSQVRSYAVDLRKCVSDGIDPVLLTSLASITQASLDLVGITDDLVKTHSNTTANTMAKEFDPIDTTVSLASVYQDANAWLRTLKDPSFEMETMMGYDNLVKALTSLSNSVYALLSFRTKVILNPIKGETPVMSSVYSKNGTTYVRKVTSAYIPPEVISNYAKVSPINTLGPRMVSLRELDRIAQEGQRNVLNFNYKSSKDGIKAMRVAIESAIYRTPILAEYTREQKDTISDMITGSIDGIVAETIALDTVTVRAVATAMGNTALYDVHRKVNHAMESASVGAATMTDVAIKDVGAKAMSNAFAQVLCSNIAHRF